MGSHCTRLGFAKALLGVRAINARLGLYTVALGCFLALVLVRAPARALDPNLLTSTALGLVPQAQYVPDGGTHCNIFAHDFVDQVLGMSVPEMGPDQPNQWDANAIFTQLQLSATNGGSWKDVTGANDQSTYDNVAQLAMGGSIVIAAWPDPGGPMPHGHLAIVMPMPEVSGYSGAYQVPVIAQAGGAVGGPCNTNGVFMNLGLSCGFNPTRRPNISFFQYVGPGS